MFAASYNVRQLLARANEAHWVQRTCNKSGEFLRWLPIAAYDAPSTGTHHSLGIRESGHWSWEYSNRTRVAPPENLVGFFSLLEFARPTAVAQLTAGVARCGLPRLVVYSFPLDAVIILALRSGGHWRHLAERWIGDGYPLTEDIATLLPHNGTVQEWRRERLKRLFETP